MIRPQVVAHRGSSALHADNSWPAFEAAAREGADAIECDVQATRDRIIVVRHDLAIDDRLVAAIPDGWLAADGPVGGPDGQRKAYVRYLMTRLDAQAMLSVELDEAGHGG